MSRISRLYTFTLTGFKGNWRDTRQVVKLGDETQINKKGVKERERARKRERVYYIDRNRKGCCRKGSKQGKGAEQEADTMGSCCIADCITMETGWGGERVCEEREHRGWRIRQEGITAGLCGFLCTESWVCVDWKYPHVEKVTGPPWVNKYQLKMLVEIGLTSYLRENNAF